MISEKHLLYKKSITCKNLISKFNMLFEIVSLYTDAIIYPNCIGNKKRTLDSSTELLTYLAICRHSILAVEMEKILGELGVYQKC